ncbi:MAG: DUF1549 domain-containing protein, partial [Gemmataceae bacterium]
MLGAYARRAGTRLPGVQLHQNVCDFAECPVLKPPSFAIVRAQFLIVPILLGASRNSFGADPAEFFESKIRPILSDRCFSCHSDQTGKKQGGLALDSREGLLAGGNTGPAIVVNKPSESLLIRAIHGKDESVAAMPPKGDPLRAETIQHFEEWIRTGAVFPGPKIARGNPLEFWSFRPLKAQELPVVKNREWPRGRIDRFLLGKLEAAGLAPAADADASTVLRRLTTVVWGLPPSLDQQSRFGMQYAKDPDAAVRQMVDELLASPHYGERFARHWMDVVRYADTTGYEYDYAVPGAWRYRDYLIRAFQADLPFDQFLTEHVAGDRVPPRVVDGRAENQLATVWWNLGPAANSPVDLAMDEAERMDDRLDVLSKAFTGVTLACARCHDHKFDPIPTKDYYSLFGVAAATPAARRWANEPQLAAIAAAMRKERDAAEATLPKPKPIPAGALANNDPAGSERFDFADGLPKGWTADGQIEAITPENAGLRQKPPGLWSGTLSKAFPAAVRSEQFINTYEYVDLLVAGRDSTIQIIVGNYQQIRDPIYQGLRAKISSADW